MIEQKREMVCKIKPRYMGRVLNWNKDRKYGFIQCFEDGQSYFAHITQLVDDYELVKGSIVEFEIGHDRRNPDKVYAIKLLVCEVPERSRNRKY